jgi:hypothetical protein
MTNFLLRFFYEVVFEICLCAVLYISYVDFARNTSVIVFAISVVIIIVLFVCLGFCLSLGFKNGPYAQEFYQKGTVMSSFW